VDSACRDSSTRDRMGGEGGRWGGVGTNGGVGGVVTAPGTKIKSKSRHTREAIAYQDQEKQKCWKQSDVYASKHAHLKTRDMNQ